MSRVIKTTSSRYFQLILLQNSRPSSLLFKYENMAATNVLSGQNRQTLFHKPAGNTLIPVFRHNGQVVEKAASPVVSAKNGSNDLIAIPSRKAKPGASLHVAFDALARVRLAQRKTLR